jgi:signal transduction histidine kinase
MNKSQFYLHDLNNKLGLLYGLLNLSQRGSPIPQERVDVLVCRINEIIKILQKEMKFQGPEGIDLTHFNREGFCDFLASTIKKLRAIYPGLSIYLSSIPEFWADDHVICIEKELLYQAIENAVENAFNAQSDAIIFNLCGKQNRLVLELIDNGRGFQDIENANVESLLPQANGMDIIKQNMKRMGAQVVYAQNNPTGTTLSFHFLLS